MIYMPMKNGKLSMMDDVAAALSIALGKEAKYMDVP
jgi:hypothetical protein